MNKKKEQKNVDRLFLIERRNDINGNGWSELDDWKPDIQLAGSCKGQKRRIFSDVLRYEGFDNMDYPLLRLTKDSRAYEQSISNPHQD